MATVEPLSVGRFADFAQLCGEMGPNRSCWCLWWREVGGPRVGRARARAETLVAASPHPIGVLAYENDRVVGWAAVSPRLEYPRLNAGRDTAPLGDLEGIWAVPCFFIVADQRGRGHAARLLDAAVDLARGHGACAVEGVPVDPATRRRTAAASYTGPVGLFRAAGFTEVARRTPQGRVLMRREIAPSHRRDPLPRAADGPVTRRRGRGGR